MHVLTGFAGERAAEYCWVVKLNGFAATAGSSSFSEDSSASLMTVLGVKGL